MNYIKGVAIVVVCAVGVSALGGCSTVHKVKRTLALNDLHIQAAIAEEKGDDATAYELWTNYVDRRPQSALAEYRLGVVETRMGKLDAAISHLRVAHDLKPGEIEYLEALAGTLAQADRVDSLMRLLNETVDEGEAGSGQLRVARYARRVGLMDEAKNALEQAIISYRGTSPVPYLEMADFANSIGDRELEVLNLRYALSFDASDEKVLNRLGELGIIPGPSLALTPSL